MNSDNNIKSKNKFFNAHYGARDWLAQRITAVIMVIYTIILLFFLLTTTNFSYENWSNLFQYKWFKIISFSVLICLFYHAWIGIRDILMDYVKSVIIKLILYIFSILWLINCANWAIQILWRI
ncbi:succinate dehydrogenase, hydrophobic membrane anchor protein [Candidatus Profftella armatura (Diaphorina cf. continua)]|uniref:Succinate dehydrogenase hydrophobic membrane anchor subunit n=1 Tax=Candidatus Profftella armatura (Diaphorina cf. continua) TaxID=2661583 RepID=A0A7R6VZJ3_9PROT|nr:succinate dehydrogenase, hydrophobic membrane anchor protein [Candidatus Profftella armatura (Diaphorina cf. continua)]BCG49496.1 succinate dehydrogenase, hydrophobic membrane anchor protein [Candidatus Profftella armatura (Diaphorina cf. continua)]